MRVNRTMLAAGLSLAVLAAGCGGGGGSTPTVPEGEPTVSIDGERLVPVRDACHVQGTVTNLNPTRRLDVTLRYQAVDAAEKLLGTTRTDLTGLAPGEQRSFNATGFAANGRGLVPCSAIARFDRIETTITPR